MSLASLKLWNIKVKFNFIERYMAYSQSIK